MASTSRANLMIREARVNRAAKKLAAIGRLKARIEELTAELEVLEAEVLPVMKAYEKTFDYGGDSYTGVFPTRTYYNEATLRRALGEKIWKQVEKVSLDRDKLGGLVTAGVVKAELVAEHATVTDVKAYVRVTRGGRKAAGRKAA